MKVKYETVKVPEKKRGRNGEQVKKKVRKPFLKKWGNGWNLQKMHSLLHLPKHISDLGSPLNFRTDRMEANHKTFAKDPGSQAQKQHSQFLQPTACNLHANHLRDTAKSAFRFPNAKLASANLDTSVV